MRVLIDPRTNTLHDIVDDEFQVAAPLRWVEAPDGLTREWTFNGSAFAAPSARGIEVVRRERLDYITAHRQAALKRATVEFDGATYDADETSVARMTNAITMLQLFAGDPRAPSTVAWLDASNTPRTLTTAQLAELAAAAWIATQTVWGRNHAAKVAIEAARTIDAIDAVEWPS